MSDEELQKMNKEQLLGIIKAQRFEISILKDDKEHLGEFLKERDEEIERLNNLLKETSQTLSEQTTKAITLKSENERIYSKLDDNDKEIERLNNIIKEVKDYIRSKSIKFTMAYVEDDGRIDLSRSDYRIDKLTSKQVKELLEILDKEKE